MIREAEWAHKRRFHGYLIPPSWFDHIQTTKGKPWTIACLILSDIIFWYTPAPQYDEFGRVTGYKMKFDGDMLHRSASFYAKQFGVGVRTIEKVMPYLEKKGLVRREMRDFLDEDPPRANVPFVAPVPEAIEAITKDSNPSAKSADPPSAKSADKDIYNSLLLRSKGGTPPDNPVEQTMWDRYGFLFSDEEEAVRHLYGLKGNGQKNQFLANMLVAYGSPDLTTTHKDYSQIIGRIGRLRLTLRRVADGDAHELLLRSFYHLFGHDDFQKTLDEKADMLLPSRMLDYLTKVASTRETNGRKVSQPTKQQAMEVLDEL